MVMLRNCEQKKNGLKSRRFLMGLIPEQLELPSKKVGGFTPTPNLVWGFTLIELLVVVAIIALLTSIILFSLTTWRDKANDARIIADISQVRIVAEAISKDYNSYGNLCCAVAACDIGTLNQGAPAPYDSQLGIIENDIKTWQRGALSINCKASFSSYCFDANLITAGSGRYCIDDNGYATQVAESFSCAAATTTCQ